MGTQGFLFTNALQIPDLFMGPYQTTERFGFLIFSLMLVCAILHENFLAMKGESSYTGLLIRGLLVVGLLILYERFFVWVVYGSDLLAKAILPEEEFKQVVQAVFREILEEKDLGVLKFFSIITVLNFITYSFAMALLGVLTWLRFMLLALLYVLGPILIGAGIYKGTAQGLRFWLKSLVSVSLWTVVLAILMKVVSTMNLTAIYEAAETNASFVFSANILFILLFISVPILTHQIASGGAVSGLATTAIGIGSALAGRAALAGAGKVGERIRGGGPR